MDAVEETNLEETIGELSILVCVIIIVVWRNQTITCQPLIDVPILSTGCIMVWKHLPYVARTMEYYGWKKSGMVHSADLFLTPPQVQRC